MMMMMMMMMLLLLLLLLRYDTIRRFTLLYRLKTIQAFSLYRNHFEGSTNQSFGNNAG